MSDEPKSILASLPLPGVLAILTAVAGTVLVQFQPLTPRRPMDSNQKPLANPNSRKIDSALLEDPFAVLGRTTFREAPSPPKPETPAADGAQPASTPAPPPRPAPAADSGEKLITPVRPDVLKKELANKMKLRKSLAQVLVIPVIARPFTDAASTELRSRLRQSLVEALYASGYSAEDPRFLECLRIESWNSDNPQPGSSGSRLDVPFEWFEPKELVPALPDGGPSQALPQHRRVLVLWLNNKLLGHQQVARLRELLHMICPDYADAAGAAAGENVIVRALGPYSTEQLGYLAGEKKNVEIHRKEVSEESGGQKAIPEFSFDELPEDSRVAGSWPGRIEMFSHAATGSAASVLRAAGHGQDEIRRFQTSKGGAAAELDKRLNGKAASKPFVRTISTDDQVAIALVNELERRLDWLPWQVEGEDCWRRIQKFGQVAIISEMDSPYGRELPVMYREEASHRWEDRMLAPLRERFRDDEKNPDKVSPSAVEICKALLAFRAAQARDERKLGALSEGAEKDAWRLQLQDARLRETQTSLPRSITAYLRLNQLDPADLAALEGLEEKDLDGLTYAQLADKKDPRVLKLLGALDVAARRLQHTRDRFAKTFPWFPYIRGLDGRGVLAVAKQKESGGGAKSSGGPDKDYRPDEEPMGPNHSDSLRRLAMQIEEMDRAHRKDGGRGILAVGVLGSDVFDKLMILRALRIRMPRTLFFTNNLDAWMWDKDEIRSSQNLIVASPYGLALEQRYQRGLPPFRDSYQTASFAAAMSALGMIPKHQFSPSDPVGAVRLFEIGLDGPHEISTNTRFTDDKADDEREKRARRDANLWETLSGDGGPTLRIASIHPARLDSKEWWDAAGRRWLGWLLLLTATVAVGVWWLLVLGGEEHGYGDGIAGVCKAVSASTGLCILIAAPMVVWISYYLWGIGRFEGEPYAFGAGLSAWPSEMIRMMCIILGIHFIWKSFFILDRNRKAIEKRFQLDSQPVAGSNSRPSGQAGLSKRVLASLHEISRQLRWKSQSVSERIVPSSPAIEIRSPSAEGAPSAPVMERKKLLDPSTLWQEYQGRSTLSIRAIRTLFVFAVFAVLSMLVFQLLGGNPAPVRGRAGIYFFGALSIADLDVLLDFLSLFTLLLLTAFVLDTMWLSRGFIQRFAAAESDWSALRPKFNGRKLRHEIIDGYIDLKITGQLTSEVMRLAFFPFYVLGLLLLARISRFDNWGWPPAVMVVFSSIVALLIFGAVRVRAQADQMRKEALADFQAHCDAGNAGGDGGPGDDNSVKAHRIEITAFREGAFAPFSEQPTMKAVFWLIGAIGAGGLWQYLAQMFG